LDVCGRSGVVIIHSGIGVREISENSLVEVEVVAEGVVVARDGSVVLNEIVPSM
jgi:hypothetical protein